MDKSNFVESISKGALEGWEDHKILPSLTIAQGILESAWGQSKLAKEANNLFGIKDSKDWTGETYSINTTEFIDGEKVTVEAKFRKYDSPSDSVRDHGNFFTSTEWRKNNYKNVFGETDYVKAVEAILPPKAEAGYATDPLYKDKIVSVIEQNKLYEYDKKVINEQEVGTSSSEPKEENVMSKVVVLDIGHGSNTFPANGKGVRVNGVGYAEHNFNSTLALKLRKLLQDSGVTVVFGQEPFSPDIPLATRTARYNKLSNRPDLILSIHANAGVPSAFGRCAFYWNSSSQSRRLAETVISEIKSKGYSTHGNGLHSSVTGSWTNLHMTRVPANWAKPVPSVLVEYGFMTSTKDFPLIFGNKQGEYTDDMAVSTAVAICKFLGIAYKGGQMESPKVPTIVTPSSTESYKVKSGDTLWGIAQANGISVEDLKSINGLKDNIIQPNQELIVKVKEDKKDEVILTRPDTYTVMAGDTLGEVSTEFDIKMDDLIKWNGISNPDLINVGTVLKLKSDAVIPSQTPTTTSPSFLIGERVRISPDAKTYATDEPIPASVKNRTYTIMQRTSDKVLLQEIMSWVRRSDIDGATTVSPVASAPKPAPKPASSGITKGQTVRLPANKLYATGNSKYPVNSKATTAIVETVHDGWKNQVRLKNSRGVLIGFAKISDLTSGTATTASSTAVKVGDKVTANRLYISGYSGSPVRTTPVSGYVETINKKSWTNPYRLTKTKGGKDYIGYARSIDIKK